MYSTRFPYIIFFALFAVLPYPRGSTFDWAWLLIVLVIFLLSAWWLSLYLADKVQITPAFMAGKTVMVLLALWLTWVVFQMISFPIGLLEVIAPLSADVYQQTDSDITWAPISIDVQATKEQLFMGMAYLFTFMLTLLLIDTPKKLRQFAGWLVGLAVVQALLATILLFSGQYIFYKADGGGSAQGTFANRNQLAGFLQINLAIGIGLLFASMRNERSRNWRERLQNIAGTMLSSKIRLRIYLAIMVITLVLTHSRMGNTAFFASMTITGVLALVLMKHSPRPLVILLASLIIIDIFIVSQWFGLDQLTKRFTEMQAEKITLSIETNTSKRLDTTMHAKQLHKDAGWTGTGAGTFFSIFSAYQGGNQKGYFEHAHNDYMEFLTDTGWPGLILLGSVVILTFIVALRAMRKRNHPLMRGMAFSSAMGIISLMIHSTTDFNFRIPSNAMLFMVILAFAYIASAMPIERK